jgi:hypothetical protein
MSLRTCDFKDMMLCHWASSSNILNNCNALTNSSNYLPNNKSHARSLEFSNLHYARKKLSCVKLFTATIPKKLYIYFSILVFTNINLYKNQTMVEY